jgi:hypothetical protein
MMIAELMVVELFIITLVAGMPDLTYKRELKQSTEHANLLNESVMDASDDTEARADLTPALAESPYQTSPLGVFQLECYACGPPMKYFLESPDPSASHGLPEGFAAHLVADCKDWLGLVKKCEPLEVCITRFEGGKIVQRGCHKMSIRPEDDISVLVLPCFRYGEMQSSGDVVCPCGRSRCNDLTATLHDGMMSNKGNDKSPGTTALVLWIFQKLTCLLFASRHNVLDPIIE